jgi:hypothetical protein
MSMDGVPIRWSQPARIAFRFCFAYLLLYNLPFPIYFLPWKGEWLAEKYAWPWEQLVPWVGDTFFGVDAHGHPTGSGDTWNAYVSSFCMLVMSAIATVVWSVLDRKREGYPRLLDGLRSYVRLVLGMTLISYGLAKVFWTQFPFPDGERLARTYGESSPMGILWSFMGYSYGYNLFTGGVECLGGLLLWWRRTTLLGALVSAAAMLQVFILNVCYDVPVKLYSFHLLLMAVWIALPDLRRLVDFFILHRTVEPRPPRALFTRRWLERARRPVKAILLAWITYKLVDGEIDSYNKWGRGMARHPMQEIYKVDRQIVAGVEKPPLTTDATRWKRFTIWWYQRAMITFMDDHQARYEWAIDEKAQTIKLTSTPAPGSTEPKGPDLLLYYSKPDAQHLVLTGDIDGKPNAIIVTVVPRESFLLVNRGFHWHQEYPFNR